VHLFVVTILVTHRP